MMKRINSTEYHVTTERGTFRLSKFNGWWYVRNLGNGYYAAFGTVPAARRFVLTNFA